jgi:hypothetical protein
MKKFRQNYENIFQKDDFMKDETFRILRKMAENGVFKYENIMTSPNMTYQKSNRCSDSVMALSRSYKASYTMQFAQDLKGICGMDSEEVIIDVISTEIQVEIELHIRRKKLEYFPYIPVIPFRAVDPEFFQPMIGFKGIYGVRETGGRLL